MSCGHDRISQYLPLFEELVACFHDGKLVTPTLVSRILTGMLPELKRDGVDIDKLCDDHFRQVFSCCEQGAFSREGIDPFLGYLLKSHKCLQRRLLLKQGFQAVILLR